MTPSMALLPYKTAPGPSDFDVIHRFHGDAGAAIEASGAKRDLVDRVTVHHQQEVVAGISGQQHPTGAQLDRGAVLIPAGGRNAQGDKIDGFSDGA